MPLQGASNEHWNKRARDFIFGRDDSVVRSIAVVYSNRVLQTTTFVCESGG